MTLIIFMIDSTITDHLSLIYAVVYNNNIIIINSLGSVCNIIIIIMYFVQYKVYCSVLI